jgi:hypothetical protein
MNTTNTNVRSIQGVDYSLLRTIVMTLLRATGSLVQQNNEWAFHFRGGAIPGFTANEGYQSEDQAYEALIGALYGHAKGSQAA